MPQKQPPAKTAVSTAVEARPLGRSAGTERPGAWASERAEKAITSTAAKFNERIGLPQVSTCKLFQPVISSTLSLAQQFPDLRPEPRLAPAIAGGFFRGFRLSAARGLE